MPQTDTIKSQATSRTSCYASHKYQQITGNKSYILPCLMQIPANRPSCHASYRCQQFAGSKSFILPCLTQIPAITGNKSYILRCLTQIPAHHRQQIVHVTMPHGDTSKSQATNRTSCHASRRYQQIAGNKLYILPCLTQIPANHRQQIVHLTMPHTDTSKSQATCRRSYNASYRYQTTQAILPTTRTSCHASHRYQQITGNKSYILPSLTQIPANHRQQTNRTPCHASHRYLQITGNKSCFLPCLTQVPANHRQQIVHLTMPHTDTSKSQATNRTSCHASHRYQQITGNKSYIFPCLTQIPANHRQQIVHPSMPHADTRKSQATNRTSCHASHRYKQIAGNKSYILPCLTQIPANHRQQIPHTDTSKS